MASEDDCPVACFFKLILEPRQDLRKLEIPNKFIATHGKDLSSAVYLKAPSGEVWKCKLVSKNGKTLLREGWPNFVEYYSLSHGHFLVFKYHRHSRFTVVICSMTASEIDYPYGHDDDNDDDDDNDKEADMDEEVQSSRELESPLATQGKSTDSLVNDHDLSEQGEEVTIDEYDKSVVIVGRNSCLTPDARKLVEDHAHQFKHPSFAAGILPSGVLEKFSVAIPNEFRRRYLDVKSTEGVYTINLKTDKSNKTWPVRVLNGASYTSMKLGRGWKQFARDNMIKVGDICIFELIDEKQFKVSTIVSDSLLC